MAENARRLALVCRTRQEAYGALAEWYALKPRERRDYERFEHYASEAARSGRLARRYARLAGQDGVDKWLRGVA